MSGPIVAALLAIGLVVGVLIGAIGIGGVLLVPALTCLGGMAIHAASAMVAYFFAGSMGAIEFSRQGSIRWSDAAWLAADAMPGAFIGAASASAAPAFALLMTGMSGPMHSSARAEAGRPAPRPPRA